MDWYRILLNRLEQECRPPWTGSHDCHCDTLLAVDSSFPAVLVCRGIAFTIGQGHRYTIGQLPTMELIAPALVVGGTFALWDMMICDVG